MGYLTNANAFRYGYTKKWVSSWVAEKSVYKTYFQRDYLIFRIIRNLLNNYGNPDFSREFLRNNKKQKKAKTSGQSYIIQNNFVTSSFRDSLMDTWRLNFTRFYKKRFHPLINKYKPALSTMYRKNLEKYVNKLIVFFNDINHVKTNQEKQVFLQKQYVVIPTTGDEPNIPRIQEPSRFTKKPDNEVLKKITKNSFTGALSSVSNVFNNFKSLATRKKIDIEFGLPYLFCGETVMPVDDAQMFLDGELIQSFWAPLAVFSMISGVRITRRLFNAYYSRPSNVVVTNRPIMHNQQSSQLSTVSQQHHVGETPRCIGSSNSANAIELHREQMTAGLAVQIASHTLRAEPVTTKIITYDPRQANQYHLPLAFNPPPNPSHNNPHQGFNPPQGSNKQSTALIPYNPQHNPDNQGFNQNQYSHQGSNPLQSALIPYNQQSALTPYLPQGSNFALTVYNEPPSNSIIVKSNNILHHDPVWSTTQINFDIFEQCTDLSEKTSPCNESGLSSIKNETGPFYVFENGIVCKNIPFGTNIIVAQQLRDTINEIIKNHCFIKTLAMTRFDDFNNKGFFKNVLELTNFLGKEKTELFFFCNLSLIFVKNLKNTEMSPEMSIIYKLFFIPHTMNKQLITMITPKILKNCVFNFYNFLTDKNKIITVLDKCKNLSTTNITLLEEELMANKSNIYEIFKLMLFDSKKDVFPAKVWSTAGQPNPDYIKKLPDFLEYNHYFFDCKNIYKLTISNEDHVRLLNNEGELSKFSLLCHEDLIFKLTQKAQKASIIDALEIRRYQRLLNANMTAFLEKKITLEVFVENYWVMHDSFIALIMKFKIKKNMPQMISMDDFVRDYFIENSIIDDLCDSMAWKSTTFKIFLKVLKNNPQIVADIKKFTKKFLAEFYKEFL